MKKFVLVFLVVGLMFSMAACDSGGDSGGTDTSLDGTWVHPGDGSELILNKGNWESPGFAKGTYKINGSSVIFTITHVHIDYFQGAAVSKEWYTKAEAKAEILPKAPEYGMTEAEMDTNIDYLYEGYTVTLSEDGNYLDLPGLGYFIRK